MTSPLLESRRELRKCAFQALMSLEFGTEYGNGLSLCLHT